MAKYTLPYFGEIDTEKLDESYQANISHKEAKIRLDLNFEGETFDNTQFTVISDMLNDIGYFDEKNQLSLKTDFVENKYDAVKVYIEHHLEEMDHGDLSRLVDFGNASIAPEIQLLNSLKLIRVGFYPANENHFAIFDYSICEDITQYVLTISIDKGGNLLSIEMES